jgi:hypothetical protein
MYGLLDDWRAWSVTERVAVSLFAAGVGLMVVIFVGV